MKLTWRHVVAIPILLVLFQLAACASGLFAIVALLFGQTRFASRVVHAQDCLAAAMIGYSGRETISKECGREHPQGTFCRRICRWLDWADEGHCEREGAE